MKRTSLSIGMTGGDVTALQSALRVAGYDIPEAEIKRVFFGPATRKAVLQFQKQHDFPSTGVVDERTSAAIATASAPKPASSPVPLMSRPMPPPPASSVVPSDARVASAPTAPQAHKSPVFRSKPAQKIGAPIAASGSGASARPTTGNPPAPTTAMPNPSVGTTDASSAAAPALPEISLTELASVLGRPASGVISKLAANGIRTLTDVRRAGGLATIAGRNEAATAQLIEAHADLSRFSSNLSANAALITGGYDSTLKIARASRSAFIATAAPILGNTAAARIQLAAVSFYRILDQLQTSARVDAANRLNK